MGVRFNREYEDIITELAEAIGQIKDTFLFLNMTSEEWEELEQEERSECLRTIADDVFYGLGTEKTIRVGSGVVGHDVDHHVMKVFSGENLVSLIHLV